MYARFPSIPRLPFYAAVACLLAPIAAQAGFTDAPDIITTPGASGSFEISLSVPTGGTTSTVTSFSLTLNTTATTGTGLSFTGVSMATSPDPYIFAGNSSVTASNPFSTTTFPTTDANPSAEAADTDSNTAGQAITAGSTFGAVEVSYSVDSDATPGVYTLGLQAGVNQTGSTAEITLPGTITIVPEPNSGLLAGVAAAVALFAFWRGRRCAA